jgi:class 3 adenylate cyclase
MELTHAFVARRLPDPAFHLPAARIGDKAVAGYTPRHEVGVAYPEVRHHQRVATLLMTDIVSSTRLIARLGDVRWADLLEHHNEQARADVERFGGRIVDFAGDRVFAVFQSTQCAIEAATAIHDAMRTLGLDVRAGVHTGEVEIREDQVIGLAVHVAARIAACARPGETLVSRRVKDLLDDSDDQLSERGVYTLKGVPNRWQLFSVRSPDMLHRVPAAHDGFDRRTTRSQRVQGQLSAAGAPC